MSLRCVDASFVVAWLVPSQGSTAVDEAWLPYVAGQDDFIAPPILYPETISSIRRLASRGLLPEQGARRLVTDFLALDIRTHTPPGLYQRAYELSARYGLSTVYDMCYLALAEQFSCDLLTLDKRLHRVAQWDFPRVTLVQ